MKTYKLIYSSQEDCNCSNSHDTMIVEDYKTLEESLDNFHDLNLYEAHDHSVIKSVSLQIEEEGATKEYSLATQDWNYGEKQWNDIKIDIFNIDQPDDEY